jgi:hypothetical protein
MDAEGCSLFTYAIKPALVHIVCAYNIQPLLFSNTILRAHKLTCWQAFIVIVATHSIALRTTAILACINVSQALLSDCILALLFNQDALITRDSSGINRASIDLIDNHLTCVVIDFCDISPTGNQKR